MSLVNQFEITLKNFLPERSDGMMITDRDRGTRTTVSSAKKFTAADRPAWPMFNPTAKSIWQLAIPQNRFQSKYQDISENVTRQGRKIKYLSQDSVEDLQRYFGISATLFCDLRS
jgi:hypothetical protein